MEDCITSTNVRQKGISQAMSFSSSFHQTGNVNNVEVGGHFAEIYSKRKLVMGNGQVHGYWFWLCIKNLSEFAKVKLYKKRLQKFRNPFNVNFKRNGTFW